MPATTACVSGVKDSTRAYGPCLSPQTATYTRFACKTVCRLFAIHVSSTQGAQKTHQTTRKTISARTYAVRARSAMSRSRSILACSARPVQRCTAISAPEPCVCVFCAQTSLPQQLNTEQRLVVFGLIAVRECDRHALRIDSGGTLQRARTVVQVRDLEDTLNGLSASTTPHIYLSSAARTAHPHILQPPSSR